MYIFLFCPATSLGVEANKFLEVVEHVFKSCTRPHSRSVCIARKHIYFSISQKKMKNWATVHVKNEMPKRSEFVFFLLQKESLLLFMTHVADSLKCGTNSAIVVSNLSRSIWKSTGSDDGH